MTSVAPAIDSLGLARSIRLTSLELCYLKKASHIGGAFSIADVLAVLYSEIISCDSQNPGSATRDRLYYSKGHACTALYSVLAEKGFFSRQELLNNFATDGSYFTSHINHRVPGVELSTGSLGHALGVACGSALALKRKQSTSQVYAIVSDGELDEGSNWEAILFAPHHRLDNLTLIVDYNKIQSFGTVDEVLSLHSLPDKFKAFNWITQEVDGHDHNALKMELLKAKKLKEGKPTVIVANTVKGKGVSFMEDLLLWHYKSPSEAEYLAAKLELETSPI